MDVLCNTVSRSLLIVCRAYLASYLVSLELVRTHPWIDGNVEMQRTIEIAMKNVPKLIGEIDDLTLE